MWWKTLGFAGYMLGWLQRASQDGKITQTEMLELISQAMITFDINVEIEVPPAAPMPTEAPGYVTGVVPKRNKDQNPFIQP